MSQSTEALLRQYFEDNPVKQLGVAVSGGGDSMALLHLLQTLRLPLHVVTVDHGLRPEAKQEAAQVAAFCAAQNLPHTLLNWTDWDGQGNLQAQARAARYRLIARWAQEHHITDIALGHTADDNTETFVMGLTRGAGLDGLSGMRPRFMRDGVTFHRPLLGTTRATLRALLEAHNIRWSEDPSNDDPSFARIRIRTALQDLGADRPEIAKVIENLSQTRAAIEQLTHDWAATHLTFQEGDILAPTEALTTLNPELRRRVTGHILRFLTGRDYPPRAEKLMPLVRSEAPQGTVHGCLITQEDGQEDGATRFAREAAALENMVNKTTELWDGRWQLDGPHSDGLKLYKLGFEGLKMTPFCTKPALPRASLAASPAIWNGDTLIAAPLAGYTNGWCARLTRSREQFLSGLLSH